MIEKTLRSNFQRELLVNVGKKVATLGFAAQSSGQSFYQSLPEGKWAFHISFIPHKNDLDLTADVAVRIDAIEDLVNKYDSKRSLSEKKNTVTLGGELGNISEGRPRRWTLSERENIAEVSRELFDALKKIGLPFLREHTSLQSAYHVLTGSDPRVLQLSPILGPRYMRAFATAYLLGDIERLTILTAQFEAELLAADDPYLQDVRALCRDLSPSHP